MEEYNQTFSADELAFQTQLGETNLLQMPIHKALQQVHDFIVQFESLCETYGKTSDKRIPLIVQLQYIKAKHATLMEKCMSDEDAVVRFFFLHERINDLRNELIERCEEEARKPEHSCYNHDGHNEDDVAVPDKNEKLEKEIEEVEEEDEDANENFECPVCFSDCLKKHTHEFSDCGHRYCKTCLATYIEGVIMDGGDAQQMKCIYPNCDTYIPDNDLRKLVSADLVAKYERFSLMRCLSADPNAHWCPFPDCDNVMIAENGETRVRCALCFRSSCTACKTPWHSTMSCEEYKISVAPEDKETAKWKNKNGVKSCPHCGLLTIRVSGCPDMICAGCKLHWDWNTHNPRQEKETLIERAAYAYPRALREVLGSRDTLADWNKNRKKTAKELMPFVVCSTIVGIPAMCIAGPPAYIIKKRRAFRARRKA